MPPKKAGKASKKSVKKTELWAFQMQLQKFKHMYDEKCKLAKSHPHPHILSMMRSHIEECKCLIKFIFIGEKEPPQPGVNKLKFAPLIAACRASRYIHVKELYIWDYEITIEEITALEDFLRQSIYSIKYLELMECNLNPLYLKRLCRNFRFVYLTSLVLDYNAFGDEGCKCICSSLTGNCTLLGLSLSYCNITAISGETLGKLISSTAIKDLNLDGNFLGCEGLMNLIVLIADKAEMEAIERSQAVESSNQESKQNELLSVTSAISLTGASSTDIRKSVSSATAKSAKDGKKKKRKRSAKKVKAVPKVGPWLEKLHIVNNGIDGYGAGKSYAPMLSMRLLSKWIANSSDLKEIDIDDNTIGDLAAREVLQGLTMRQANGLSGIKIHVTHRINNDTFTKILTFSSQKSGKKKKKGKRKTGKKKL